MNPRRWGPGLRRARDPEGRRAEMVAELVEYGIEDDRVLGAMAEVPRERFVADDLADRAYDDGALPIAEGQTISQPYIVAAMSEALEPRPADRVLEIGTGSGYGAAVLSRIVDHVVTIERIAPLADHARAVLADLGYDNVTVVVADGSLGWPDGAPFDGIVVTAGGPEVPEGLVAQLAPDRRLVMPVGPPGAQDLVAVTRRAEGVRRVSLGPVAFVPLVGEAGWPDRTEQ